MRVVRCLALAVVLVFALLLVSQNVSAQYGGDDDEEDGELQQCQSTAECTGLGNTCSPDCQGTTPWCSGGHCVYVCYDGCEGSCSQWGTWTSCYWDGIRYVETRVCIDGRHSDSQIRPCSGGGGNPPGNPGNPGDPEDPPGTTITPTHTPPTPTPPITYFSGGVYSDPNAVPLGLGGSDNLCTGNTSSLAPIGSASVSVQRTGENLTQDITEPIYTIRTGTNQSDYTIYLHLPFPPPDPENAWICACNALPGDQYICRYTNQRPSQGSSNGLTNFFVKRANQTEAAWFQILGGNSWASGNIASDVPVATCTPPLCRPALVLTDPVGTLNSPGFPLSDRGTVATSLTGGVFIHETGSRTNASQAKGLGVQVPAEGYDTFFRKIGDQAVPLGNANKPTPASNPGVYLYSGDLTINQSHGWKVQNGEQIIVLVDGNLTIDDTTVDDQPRIVTVEPGGIGFLMFIVSGDITIAPNLGYADIFTNANQANIAQVEGVYVADGTFIVARNEGNVDRKFIGAGTFVGWGGVDLQRNFDSGSTPEYNAEAATETFIFRPDFIINAPREIKSAQMTWRELEPGNFGIRSSPYN